MAELWTREETKEDQQNDQDIAQVYAANELKMVQARGVQQHGLTAAARILIREWGRVELIDCLLYVWWESADCTRTIKQLVLPYKFRWAFWDQTHEGLADESILLVQAA